MGIFSRISEIVNSNINAMLDKAENPEKMVKLMINEMEDTLIEIKSSAAEVVAERIRVERAARKQRAKSNEWESKVELALSKGREDLAREAVEQKLEYEESANSLEAKQAELEALVSQYQSDVVRLEEKLDSAKRRQRVLIASHKSAMNKKRVEEQIYQVNTSGAFARFDHYEQKIDRFNAQAEVLQVSNESLEKKFQDLENENIVEKELERIKARKAGNSNPELDDK
ncbi:MAG: phage shock protein A [Acidobacteria bacterium]|nr:MAG: phage shock protein A [Acidobacteriota bacterium]